jgi:hypothetical protein
LVELGGEEGVGFAERGKERGALEFVFGLEIRDGAAAGADLRVGQRERLRFGAESSPQSEEPPPALGRRKGGPFRGASRRRGGERRASQAIGSRPP